MLFYYIRHGDPVYVPDSLTPFGQQQAKALVERFALHGLDRVYSSDSIRAQMTAEPTCKALGLTATLAPWANESRPWAKMCVYDEAGRAEYAFEDPAMRVLFASDEMQRLGFDWDTHERFDGTTIGTCFREIGQDADAFFLSLGYRHDHGKHAYIPVAPTEERVALFAHQAFGMAFLSWVLDIPYPQFCTHFDMGHTGVTVIRFEEQQGLVIPRVLQLSSDAHLWKAELSVKYQNRIDV